MTVGQPGGAKRSGLVVCLAVLCASAALLWAGEGDGEQLFFSRRFPKSEPAYFEVLLLRDGLATYREAPEEEDPLEFSFSQQEADEVFALVEKLDGLKRAVASDRKVAFTGQKTFRYRNGQGAAAELSFSFTEDPDARTLERWFQRAGESVRYRFELERTAQFDYLGVNKALLQFQVAFEKDRIVALAQFLPILKKIARQQKFLHMARIRAASLVQRIENETAGNSQ